MIPTRIRTKTLFWGSIACSACSLCTGAYGQGKLDASVAGVRQYESNIFQLSDTVAQQSGLGLARSDWIDEPLADLDTEYRAGPQRLYASGEARRFVYERFDTFDRDEYNWRSGLDWKLTSLLDGGLSYGQDRLMLPEQNRAAPSLNRDMEFDRSANGSANLNIAPEWRVESRVDWTRQNSPAPDAEFRYNQTAYTLAAKYLGIAHVAAGLEGQYSVGNYADALLSSQYRQFTGALTGELTGSAVSTLSVDLGMSRRADDSGQQGVSSGFSGDLKYRRTISGKTQFAVDLFRLITTYPSTADTVQQTGASFDARYSATRKINVQLLAEYLDDSFQQAARRDRTAIARLGVDYAALRWFELSPAIQWQSRYSTDYFYSFADTVVSLEAKLKY
jgi:hypothetical protein